MLIWDYSNNILTLKQVLFPPPSTSPEISQERVTGQVATAILMQWSTLSLSNTAAEISSITWRKGERSSRAVISNLMTAWSHRLIFLLKWFITVPGTTISKVTSVLLKAILKCDVLIRRNKNLFISGHYHMHVQKDGLVQSCFKIYFLRWNLQ